MANLYLCNNSLYTNNSTLRSFLDKKSPGWETCQNTAPPTGCDCSQTGTTGIPQAECEALLALYNSTDGENWTNNTNWNTTSNIDNWAGVQVFSGHVKGLILEDNQLSGTIPSQIGNLTYLDAVNLSHNQLTGAIPTEIGNLTEMLVLFLNHNQLTTVPPSIENLTKMSEFHLQFNNLSSLPVEIANLSNITDKKLYLCGNIIEATDATLVSFLNQKSTGWNNCQIVNGTSEIQLDGAKSFGYVKFNNEKVILYPIQNTGSGSLVITKVTVSPEPPFTVKYYPSVVAPGNTEYIEIAYTPTDKKKKRGGNTDNGTITIEHNASGSPSTVNIQGNGTTNDYEILNNASELTLGQENVIANIPIGQMQPFEIQNTTGVALNFTVNGQNQTIAAFDKLSLQKSTVQGQNQVNFEDNGGLITIAKWLGSSIPAVPLDNWGIYLVVFLLIGFVVIKTRIS